MSRKTISFAVLTSLVVNVAFAFLPPVDAKDGVKVSIDGFDQDVSNLRKLQCAKYPADQPLAFKVTVENTTEKPVSGKLAVWLNDDWTVDGEGTADLTVAPKSAKTFPCVARAGKRVLAALYPVHASFAGAHAIGIFEATGPQTAWKVTPPRVFELKAAKGAKSVGSHKFTLESRGETFEATVTVGEKGVVDGSIVFTSADDPRCTYRIDGFDLRVLQAPSAPQAESFAALEVHSTDETLEAIHWLAAPNGGKIPLKAVFSAEAGALKLAWSMPGVTRDAAGLPRYGYLRTGAGDRSPERVYCGFGNVMVRPAKFSLSCRGFEVSSRHAGADFSDGFSLVTATALGAETLDHDPKANVFGYAAHHDNTFYFLPSAKGAFRAARNWRDVSGFAKSAGFDRLVGRMCYDEWGGNYRVAAENLRKAARYGMSDAVFVKHAWQRWGYDYRLPEIYPPSGDVEGFFDIARACREADIFFCPHDNYIDLYPDAENYSYDLVIFNKDGTPQKAWFNHGRAAQSYRWLPHAFQPWLERNCKLLRDGCGADGLFIDVFTAGHGVDYLDRDGRFYPKMRTSAEWGTAFDNARGWLGVADGPMISEAGDDHLVGHVDAGQSDHFPYWRWTRAEDGERVPWHDMATHGRMILFAGGLGHRYSAVNWDGGGDQALHGWASDDYLSNAVGGGRGPMCAGPWSRRTVMTYWLQHDTLASLAKAEFESLEFEGDDIHRFRTTFSNGGETYVNRATNRTWQVAGQTLPPYGYYVRTPEGEAGIVEREGQRCAFAQTETSLFADARPCVADCGLAQAEVKELRKTLTGKRLEVELEWTFRRSLGADFRPFVHVIPKGAIGEKIVRQGWMDVPADFQSAIGVRRATIHADFGTLDPAKHDIFYGIFNTKNHGRVAIAGADARTRMKLGSGGPAEKADRRCRELGVNVTGKMVDFGWLRTNGALKFELPEGRPNLFARLFGATTRAKVTALPGSMPFVVEIDLDKAGVSGELVKAEPALAVEQRGSIVRFDYDPAVESYELEFK